MGTRVPICFTGDMLLLKTTIMNGRSGVSDTYRSMFIAARRRGIDRLGRADAGAIDDHRSRQRRTGHTFALNAGQY